MKKASITQDICDRSPFCPAKRNCPVDAIYQEDNGLLDSNCLIVDENLCTGCGVCNKACPRGAIKFVERL